MGSLTPEEPDERPLDTADRLPRPITAAIAMVVTALLCVNVVADAFSVDYSGLSATIALCTLLAAIMGVDFSRRFWR